MAKMTNKEPKDKSGDTPLHWSAALGHLDVVKFLMQQNIDREPRNIYEVTPLHAAALEGHLNVVKYLMKRVVDKEPKDKEGNTLLHWSAAKGTQCYQLWQISKICKFFNFSSKRGFFMNLTISFFALPHSKLVTLHRKS